MVDRNFMWSLETDVYKMNRPLLSKKVASVYGGEKFTESYRDYIDFKWSEKTLLLIVEIRNENSEIVIDLN